MCVCVCVCFLSLFFMYPLHGCMIPSSVCVVSERGVRADSPCHVSDGHTLSSDSHFSISTPRSPWESSPGETQSTQRTLLWHLVPHSSSCLDPNQIPSRIVDANYLSSLSGVSLYLVLAFIGSVVNPCTQEPLPSVGACSITPRSDSDSARKTIEDGAHL